MAESFRVAHLSDTHFLAEGEEPEGAFSYDTGEAFEAVLAHMGDEAFDLVAVTGDVADHGRVPQYRIAADALSRVNGPVNVCPGNHDQADTFSAAMGRPQIGTSRVIEMGNWCFVFADSNTGVMSPDSTGRLVDPELYEDRLHTNGSLGVAEEAWIQQMHDATLAEHVFVWIHHPPDPGIAMIDDAAYADQWRTLLSALPKLRGIGAGHTHVPHHYDLGHVPVFVSPALKNNFDLEANTLLPPGYRTYTFASDGTVSSEAHITDDDRWPRHPMPPLAIALFNGEVDWPEFNAIVARKAAERIAAETAAAES